MVEIKIGNESLDIYPDEVVSLTMAISDIANIETRSGGYSNSFTIPSTANNNTILGYPSELNFVTGFKPSTARNASIDVDGLSIQTGVIQIEQYNHKDKTFSISFFSGNTEWSDLITDKAMTDINLDKYDHSYTPAVVSASMTNTSGYIYPFINYGRYIITTTNNTDLEDWMPAMYTHSLIRQMFDDIDWKVGGSIFKDPVFLKHIIPFSLKTIEQQDRNLTKLGYGSSGAFGAYGGGVTIVYPYVFKGNGLGNYNSSTGVYTASETFSASIYCSFYRSGSSIIELKRNGMLVSSSNNGGYSSKLIINAGDQITVNLTTADSSTIDNAARNQFAIVPEDYTPEDTIINMSSTMPDISQESFIQTIFNQFGILFTSDNISKTVYLNRFEDIKSNIKNAIDWTDKLDNSRDVEVDYTELVSGYAKKNKLLYKTNEDSKNAQFVGGVKSGGGNGFFEIDNDFLSKDKELFTSDFVSSSNVGAFGDTTNLMFIGRWSDPLLPKDEPDLDPSPRCAICVPSVSVSQLFDTTKTSINIIGSSTSANVTTLPYAYFDNTFTGIKSIDEVNQSLSFGDNSRPKAHRNLIETYYEDFIRILDNPRKVTAYFLLNERDINNLDYLTPIYLGGELNNYFYINKISDYRPMNGGITKVELILIV